MFDAGAQALVFPQLHLVVASSDKRRALRKRVCWARRIWTRVVVARQKRRRGRGRRMSRVSHGDGCRQLRLVSLQPSFPFRLLTPSMKRFHSFSTNLGASSGRDLFVVATEGLHVVWSRCSRTRCLVTEVRLAVSQHRDSSPD